ncbi:MAG: ribosome assembly cofactor RimP [Prolixibacteraceae bacterium]|nr:ribosome assembly cofactor RimP [Prolixibacteraceae bacterium]
MIEKAKIQQLVEEKLEEDMFLVEVSVNERNVIHVFVDSYNGLTIDQCVAVSRHVEHSLDRDEEDFELQVSSPGLTESFKVFEQYKKYEGKQIKVVTTDGTKLEGVLLESNKEFFVLETSAKEKLEGQKKKQLVVKKHQMKYNETESVKAVISFK